MATEILDNIGSGNGLLPDGTKPLPEPMLTYHHKGSVAFAFVGIALDISSKYEFEKDILKIIFKSPRANELILNPWIKLIRLIKRVIRGLLGHELIYNHIHMSLATLYQHLKRFINAFKIHVR